MSRRAFLALLAGYGLLRLDELRRSRRHERGLEERGQPRGRERGFALMVAAHLCPFVLAPIERARHQRSPAGLARAALGALAGAGALRWWTLATLGGRWTVRVRGGPTMSIATGGPYRLVRHPNYLAVIVEIAALPLAGGAWRTALLASTLDGVALALRIADEERVLARAPTWVREVLPRPRLLPLPWRRRRPGAAGAGHPRVA